MKSLSFLLLSLSIACSARAAEITIAHADAPGGVKLVLGTAVADIYVDAADAKLPNIAAGLLSDDIERVTGKKPRVLNDPTKLGADAVIVGSIGHSALVDQLIASGKIDVSQVKDKWETFTLQVVDDPLPNVASALVIAGSDRRGTAFGVFDLSEKIGVSPWYWWADVTPVHQDNLVVDPGASLNGPPSVKYRGIFINDEDWGLMPWAAKTFEPEVGNIGPKTYAKVFELILRLRGNYLWPAMHPVSTEFARIPANLTLADDWGIVMGASHTEAMNRNNVLWPREGTGEWRFDTNGPNLLAYWEQWAKLRGPYEAVWTVGIRGVHDSAMLGPADPDAKMHIVENAIAGQRDLLRKYVNSDVTKVPQIFSPYKEVLPLYQRGMKVPDDVTILWTDDNFGYIRQLPTPAEQKRSGGAGIYYHISYLGGPRSYTWLNTTPPALIWEEMTKAYAYGADRVWVANLGDIKPGEIGMDFWMKLGWNIHAFDRQAIPTFLREFAAEQFGAEQAEGIAGVMGQYYRLGFARKPEAMDTNSFNAAEASQRLADYAALLQQAQDIARKLPKEKQDAFYELVLYPVKICAEVAHVYLAPDSADALKQIAADTDYFNNTLADGKWRGIMTEKGTTGTYAFQWPKAPASPAPAPANNDVVIAADRFTHNIAQSGAQWQPIVGLGRATDAVTVFPATVASIEKPGELAGQSPSLQYDFTPEFSGAVKVTVDAIPTHRINPERGLRYAVAIDDEVPQVVDFEQPAVSTNRAWNENVIHNMSVTATNHTIAAAGKHTLKVFMVDPGVVLEGFVISAEK